MSTSFMSFWNLNFCFCLSSWLWLGACTSSYKPEADVNTLVRPQQEAWLKSEIEQPTPGLLNKLLVFGDSLSDPGNLHARTFGFYIPPATYYKSRLSNGPIWADYVSSALGWEVINYAVAGAKTHAEGLVDYFVIPSLLDQIVENRINIKKIERASTLVAIWIGPNNYFTFGPRAQNAKGEPIAENLKGFVTQAILDIEQGILKLRDLGFHQFMLGTMPELSGLLRNPHDPFKTSDATFKAATAAHNEALSALMTSLNQKYPDLKVTSYRAFSINDLTNREPQRFGFTRREAPCFVGNLRGEFYGAKRFCEEPSAHKFWEYIHPSSKMHCYYASQFLADMSRDGYIGRFDQEQALRRCGTL